MELDKIKEIVAFAKRNRIKSISVDGFSLELLPRRKKKKIAVPVEPESKTPPQKISPAPTLEQINDFIYKDPEEQSQ